MGAFEESYEDESIDVSQSDDSIFEVLLLQENTASRVSELENKLLREQYDGITPKAILHALYELAQKDYQKILTTNNVILGPEQERTMYASILEPFAKTIIKLSKTENATTGYEFIGALIAHIDASGTNNTPWILYAPLILEISKALLHATRTTDTNLLYHSIDTHIPFLTDLQGEITEEFEKIQDERSKNLLLLPTILPTFLRLLKKHPEHIIQEYNTRDTIKTLPKSRHLQKGKD